MDRIDAMRIYTRIVERGSFVRAAEDLGLPASTATDAVKQLERRLGVRLLQRTTRQVRVSPEGEAYYRRCLSILDEIDEAETAFTGAVPKGLVRVNMLGTQARKLLIPELTGFFAAYPQIDLDLSESDQFVDLIGEGVDCVIRAGDLPESDLVGRRIATVHEVTVAAPDYLARFGHPPRWDALEGHRIVGFRSSRGGGVLPLEFMVNGQLETVDLPARLTVSGVESLHAAALQGLGIIQVPEYAVRQDLAEGRLLVLMPDTPPAPMPIHILYPRNRHLSLRVRVFIDWVVGRYQTALAGD